MARTETISVELGFKAPEFRLPNILSGEILSLHEVSGENATVVMFICNHCPYVRHIMPVLVKLTNEFEAKGVRFVGINSNDTKAYPEDAPDKMKLFAAEYNFSFPYFFDETQEVAKAYNAACTPDFNIFDKNMRCVYRGNFDNSTPKNDKPVTGENMRKALIKIIKGEKIEEQAPSVGCNIKWKS